jgi:hypothetical protein
MNTIKSTGLHVGVVSVSADRTQTEVRQLEAMAAKLLETARKLPAGPATFLRRSGNSARGSPR